LSDVDAALRVLADPADEDGVQAFADECRQALSARHLRQRATSSLPRRPAAWRGLDGQLAYDALAATQPHPACPTAAARLGFTDADTLAYAPEHRPAFPLNWAAIPREALTRGGPGLPSWWPRPADVGLPAALDPTHQLIPVHPLTAQRVLRQALDEAGLPAAKLIAPATHLKVTPTLSTRTVAVQSRPGVHLKLPLATSTGPLATTTSPCSRLNRGSIVPGALPDGALIRAVVAEAAVARLLLADESCYAHAGHPFLGYLMRRLPDGLDRCHVVPLAALLAPGPGPSLVIEELARQYGDGTLAGLFRDYLYLLFGVAVHLFVRYGIALESHQHNAALVLDPDESGHPLRLLVKDFDGVLFHHPRLAAALPGAPGVASFADERLLTASDDALADVFITITVHLCAGALAFGLARQGRAPLADLLALIRRALAQALDRYPGHPAAGLLRARVLTAGRLPGTTTLTTGPNYLAAS
jgi:siderophore synthetase component